MTWTKKKYILSAGDLSYHHCSCKYHIVPLCNCFVSLGFVALHDKILICSIYSDKHYVSEELIVYWTTTITFKSTSSIMKNITAQRQRAIRKSTRCPWPRHIEEKRRISSIERWKKWTQNCVAVVLLRATKNLMLAPHVAKASTTLLWAKHKRSNSETVIFAAATFLLANAQHWKTIGVE